MVVRQRPIESITTEGASPSSTTRFTAVVRRCSSVLWSSNRPSIFIGLNISNTYASVDYPSDAAVCRLGLHADWHRQVVETRFFGPGGGLGRGRNDARSEERRVGKECR